MDEFFEYFDTPKDRKVILVASKLRKYALVWWKNLDKLREIEGKDRICTWGKMRRKLKRKYLSNK